MQKNWIGKSFGCEINFKIEGNLNIKKLNVLQQDQILFWFVFFSIISRSSYFKIL